MKHAELTERLKAMRAKLASTFWDSKQVGLLELDDLIRELEAEEPEVWENMELVWEGGADVFDVRGERCQVDAGSIVFRKEGIEKGRRLFILGYLFPLEPMGDLRKALEDV